MPEGDVLIYLTPGAIAFLREAQGSATVAIITAAGIVAPLVKDIPGYRPRVIVMASSCGSTVLSPQTLQSWTAMKLVTSVVGILIAFRVRDGDGGQEPATRNSTKTT
ncbi:MAG: hypothetical protein IT165_37345 [Bryobacterales bacterium]|nr:hypothetical protein [Bryobacterales bacterium]